MATHAIRVMLRQLLEQLETIPEKVCTVYSRDNKPGVQTGPATYKDLLTSCISEFSKLHSSRVFVVVDAYDEFENEENERKERGEFRSVLTEIEKIGNSSIFITTRAECSRDLEETFSKPIMVNMEVDIEDIEGYLNSQLEYQDLPPECQEKFKTIIRKNNEKDK